MPLNVGYVASYTQKKLSDISVSSEFRLFKDASKMMDAIEKEKPDVVGLSYYVWNTNLNQRVFDFVKEKNPNTLTIGGGPNFTNINANERGAKKFFSVNKNCDAYVVNQGEKGFFELIKTFNDLSLDVKKFCNTIVPGSLVNDLKDNNKINIKNCSNKVHVGENIGTLEDLNEIPSPYLNGMLDSFFDGPFIPILETNRSCPYRCTFCAWGIGTQKLMRFDDQRVLKEIEYIYERCKKASTLFIADANFGILERDAIFAAKIFEGYQKKGFPYHVGVQWNKTRPDRIIKTAKAFGSVDADGKSIAPIGASMQTIDDDVLTAIKRKNLTFEQINQIQKELKAIGMKDNSFSELIIGLPNETKKSHIDANRKLIDLGFEVWNYFLHLLPGTEMDEEEYRKKYFKETGWRLHDNAFGIYRGKKIFEAQETVLSTTSLSVEDFRYFRFFHFLQQMMWSKKWYFDYLKFLKNYGIHPVEVMDKIITNAQKDDGEIGNLYKQFMKDYDEAESFYTFEELYKYWRVNSNFKRLEDGDYGKLNMLFTYKVVLDCRKPFNDFLLTVAKEFAEQLNLPLKYFSDVCEEILKFQNTRFVQFKDELNVKKKITKSFKYDILNWQKNGYNSIQKLGSNTNYTFYLSDKQHKAINTQLKQYKSKNLNSTLRHMTVYSDKNQFFYHVINGRVSKDI